MLALSETPKTGFVVSGAFCQPVQYMTNKMIHVPSKYSDQTGHQFLLYEEFLLKLMLYVQVNIFFRNVGKCLVQGHSTMTSWPQV